MSRTYEKLRRQSGLHMSADGGDPFDSLPAAIAADVLGRVADGADIAACRLASRAFLAASYACSRVRLRAAALARRRSVALAGGGGGGPPGGSAIRAAAGNAASLLGPHLRSLELDASEGWGHPDDATWVEEGEFDEGGDLHLTVREAVVAWADTAAGNTLREVDVADYWPQSCWRKAEALPVISHFCNSLLSLHFFTACFMFLVVMISLHCLFENLVVELASHISKCLHKGNLWLNLLLLY